MTLLGLNFRFSIFDFTESGGKAFYLHPNSLIFNSVYKTEWMNDEVWVCSLVLPLALAGWGSWGGAGMQGVGVSETVEGCWAGSGDSGGDGGRPGWGDGSTGRLGTGSKHKK